MRKRRKKWRCGGVVEEEEKNEEEKEKTSHPHYRLSDNTLVKRTESESEKG